MLVRRRPLDHANSAEAQTETVDELMRPKMDEYPRYPPRKNDWGQSGLNDYVYCPEEFSPDRVIYFNDRFTLVHDKFPKADIHLLIIPRDRTKTRLIPQDAFNDPVFLEECRQELVKVKHMVGDELRRRYGRLSATEQPRIAAMESADPPAENELPPGRDWEADIINGIHYRGSMSNIHIHVLSGDMISPHSRSMHGYQCMKTKFLCPLEAFPLRQSDQRMPPGALDSPPRNRHGHMTQFVSTLLRIFEAPVDDDFDP
jgi:aprataxin